MDNIRRVAVLMTCFNRKEKTRKCLQSLIGCNSVKTVDATVFLVDDGCTDGTSQMLQYEFPSVKVLQGTGSLFWNQGMRFAFSEALKQHFDFYLWVNDDVVFNEHIIDKMIGGYDLCWHEKPETIIVGYTTDLRGETVTYGGYRRKKAVMPLSLEMVKPSETFEQCDTFNGNCVLIPECVVAKIGINCNEYQHGFGDIDYGFTAKHNGCKLYLTNFSVGCCEKNVGSRIWNDMKYKAPLKRKYEVMTSTTNRPTKEWKYFTRNFGGPLWFIRFAAPYIKLLVSCVITRTF